MTASKCLIKLFDSESLCKFVLQKLELVATCPSLSSNSVQAILRLVEECLSFTKLKDDESRKVGQALLKIPLMSFLRRSRYELNDFAKILSLLRRSEQREIVPAILVCCLFECVSLNSFRRFHSPKVCSLKLFNHYGLFA